MICLEEYINLKPTIQFYIILCKFSTRLGCPPKSIVTSCAGAADNLRKEGRIHTAGAFQSVEHTHRRHSGADGGATSGMPGRTTGTVVQ